MLLKHKTTCNHRGLKLGEAKTDSREANVILHTDMLLHFDTTQGTKSSTADGCKHWTGLGTARACWQRQPRGREQEGNFDAVPGTSAPSQW